MAVNRQSITTQLSVALKMEFENAIKDEFNGASDFFRRRINERCNVPPTENKTPTRREASMSTVPLNVSVTPEQRAALLRQCEEEGVTMGTWMRNEIKAYLKKRK